MNNVFFHSQNRKIGSAPPPTQTVTIPRYYFGIDSVLNYVGILAYNYNNCHYELIWNDSYGDNGHWNILDVTKSQKVIRSTPSLTLFDFWDGERLSNKKGNSFFKLIYKGNKLYASWITATTDNIGSIYNDTSSLLVKNPITVTYNITDKKYYIWKEIYDESGNIVSNDYINNFYFLTLTRSVWLKGSDINWRGDGWISSNNPVYYYTIDNSGISQDNCSFACSSNSTFTPYGYNASAMVANNKWVMRNGNSKFTDIAEYPNNYSENYRVTQSKLKYVYHMFGEQYAFIGDKEPGKIDAGDLLSIKADYTDNVGKPKNLIINLSSFPVNTNIVDANYNMSGESFPFEGSFSNVGYSDYDDNDPMASDYGQKTSKSTRFLQAIRISHRDKDSVYNNNYYILQFTYIKRNLTEDWNSKLGRAFYNLTMYFANIMIFLYTVVFNVAGFILSVVGNWDGIGDWKIFPYDTYVSSALVKSKPYMLLFKTKNFIDIGCVWSDVLFNWAPFDMNVTKNTDRVFILGGYGATVNGVKIPHIVYFSEDDFDTYTVCDFQ